MGSKFMRACCAATLLSVSPFTQAAGIGVSSIGEHPGIKLGLGPGGQVERLHVGETLLRLRGAGGLWITDFPNQQARPVTLSPGASGRWAGAVESLRLKVSLQCTALSYAVRLDLHVEDTTRRDRALVVEFALPLEAHGWTWWEDLRTRHTVAVDQTYYVRTTPSQFGADSRLSVYPLSALCGKSAGLCLAVPPDAPRDFTIRWAPSRGLSVRFHVATSPDTRRFPCQTTASLILYPCDPAWGFRSALQRYYDLFPSYFERRAKKSGAWLCGSRARTYDTPEAIAALDRRPSELFGYRLVFGHLAETISEDQAAGLVSIPFNIALAKLRYEGPAATTPADAQRLIDEVGRPGFKGRFQGFWRGPTSVRNSVLQDSQGLPVAMDLAKTQDPATAERMCSFLVNADPSLFDDRKPEQSTAGQCCLNAALRSATLVPDIGGIYFDYLSSLAPFANHRREHFPYVDLPLTFLHETGEAAIHNRFPLIEYLRVLNQHCRDPESPMSGKFIWSNGTKYFGGGVAFMAFLVDLPGFEWPVRWQKADSLQFDFVRAMGSQKPVLHTCNHSLKSVETLDIENVAAPWYHRLAFYGIPPIVREVFSHPKLLAKHRDLINTCTAVAVELQRAGWQPVTLARTSDPDVWAERFGPTRDGTTYFSLLNTAEDDRTVRLAINASLCGRAGRAVTPYPVERPGVTLSSTDPPRLRLSVAGLRMGVVRLAVRSPAEPSLKGM